MTGARLGIVASILAAALWLPAAGIGASAVIAMNVTAITAMVTRRTRRSAPPRNKTCAGFDATISTHWESILSRSFMRLLHKSES